MPAPVMILWMYDLINLRKFRITDSCGDCTSLYITNLTFTEKIDSESYMARACFRHGLCIGVAEHVKNTKNY